MKVSKRGSNLMVRIPASMVRALSLKVGDEVEVRAAEQSISGVNNKPDLQARLVKRPPFTVKNT